MANFLLAYIQLVLYVVTLLKKSTKKSQGRPVKWE